jgi:hypothetical protein
MTQYGKHRKARPKKSPVGTMILSWLIPGYGFMKNGYVARGVFFFVILQLTFLIGAALRGSVLMPDFYFRSPGFNLVNILTFMTQIFNGGLGLLSLLPEMLGRSMAILPYDESYPWADLGAFYLLVSGGMNYFVLVSTYDHFYSDEAISVTREADA